jgi:radical SAM-linked protein
LFRQRLRLWFKVVGDQRYLSHHDMMRLWERAMRRARLPLRMSQGFNPRPRVSLVEPRSVGVTSDAELLEFELADWMNPDTVLDRISRELPEGVTATSMDLVRPTDKARPEAVVYEAALPEPCPDLPARVAALLARDKAPVVRHRPTGDKALDARPFIETVEAGGDQRLRMVLLTGPGGTVRPDEILRLVGLPPEEVSRTDIKRVEIRLG